MKLAVALAVLPAAAAFVGSGGRARRDAVIGVEVRLEALRRALTPRSASGRP